MRLHFNYIPKLLSDETYEYRIAFRAYVQGEESIAEEFCVTLKG